MSDDSTPDRPRGKSPRLPPLRPAEWTEEQAAVLEPLLRDGQVFNVFATLAYHPDLLRRWLVFGTHVLHKNSLQEREREMLILRTGWLAGSEYEWGQHVLIARRCGLGDDEIRRIADGPEAPEWNDADRALLRAADELHEGAQLSSATWEALEKHLTVAQLFDLIFTVGQYRMLAGALNTIGVERDAGVPGFDDLPGHAPR